MLLIMWDEYIRTYIHTYGTGLLICGMSDVCFQHWAALGFPSSCLYSLFQFLSL